MYGNVITELPDGFVPLQQWPEYDLAHLPFPTFNPELVDSNPRGVRWSLWPFTFEEYVSETEPDLSRSDPTRRARNRLVLWRTATRIASPRGWIRIGYRAAKLEGFAELGQEAYYTHWDESAKRYRNKWLRNYAEKTHRIESIDYNTFKAAYERSEVAKKVKSLLLDMIERQTDERTRPYYEFIVVTNIATGARIAGMCLLNSPTHRASYYVSGFYTSEEGHVPAMVALMDHWFKTSHARGMRFLHFGEFWMRGKPKNWKGFSLFKAKFGLHYIAYPPALLRFMPGRLF